MSIVLHGTPEEVEKQWDRIRQITPNSYVTGCEWINEKEIRMPVFFMEVGGKDDEQYVATILGYGFK
jgi:hypothetical protein